MSTSDSRASPSPWHDGELIAQQRVGVTERMNGVGRRSVRSYMPDQHRTFFAQLPFIVAGSIDANEWPCASILSGRPGFVTSPDPWTLHIASHPIEGDPLKAVLARGTPLGLLGIELPTRRRNRMNGRVSMLDANGFAVLVDQSFGNCAQYIQRRCYSATEPAPPAIVRSEPFSRLDDCALRLIEQCDTCFVASYARADGQRAQSVDVSHRGGRSGFLGIASDGAIVVPDYPGNFFFNTIGNLVVNPRAGLLFMDFARGDLLQVVGMTEIVWEGREVRAFKGAERLWRVKPLHGRWLRGALRVRLSLNELSSNTLVTGTWREAQAALEVERLRDSWRRWRVVRVVDESSDIRSFHLEPADGLGVPRFLPGQHLPIRLPIPSQPQTLLRNYTISCAPGEGLRISVKRERAKSDGARDGVASAHLHDHLDEGSVIEAMAPRGTFIFDTTMPKPAVLLSAGIGITPMMAMLRHAASEHTRTRRMRPVFFMHSARTACDRPFRQELGALAEQKADFVRLHFVSTAPAEQEVRGTDHHSTGRISIDLLRRVLPFDDYHFYLCGPDGFMQSLYDGLRGLNVTDDRIHIETFGQSSFKRHPAPRQLATAEAFNHQSDVVFKRSGMRARWALEGSLLELAESIGLKPPHDCRVGRCGTCATPLIDGAVEYQRAPVAEVKPGEALICIAVPRVSAIDPATTVTLDL
jgi:ferredoxin-NADP reductase/predicted pyridoxine 5'-phosphate oxidase superfamily flavin-nucleotide-binding protein